MANLVNPAPQGPLDPPDPLDWRPLANRAHPVLMVRGEKKETRARREIRDWMEPQAPLAYREYQELKDQGERGEQREMRVTAVHLRLLATTEWLSRGPKEREETPAHQAMAKTASMGCQAYRECKDQQDPRGARERLVLQALAFQDHRERRALEVYREWLAPTASGDWMVQLVLQDSRGPEVRWGLQGHRARWV